MPSPRTIRILSLDGGGERGYLSTVWFNLFVKQWGINPAEIWKYFDVIAGTSIGGIGALGYAHGVTPETFLNFFTEHGPRIFTIRNIPIGCSAYLDSNTPNNVQKLGFIVTNETFYESPSNCGGNADFGSDVLYKTLIDTFGDTTLQGLKTNVLIPAYEVTGAQDGGVFTLFSNVYGSYYSSPNESVVNVAKATSAAPVYLPKVTFGGKTYLDGGIYNNNPAEFALNLGKSLKPLADRFCVLSIGTGIGNMEFYDQPAPTPPTPSQVIGFETIQQIFGLFNVAATGSQESTAKALQVESEATLSNLFYYRFQAKLDPLLDTNLDNTKSDILEYYAKVATDAFNQDSAAISNFLGHLTA